MNFYSDSKVCRTAGLEIKKVDVDVASQQSSSDDCIFETYKFVPYVHKYVLPYRAAKLEKYKIACNRIIDELEYNVKKELPCGKFSVEQKIDFDVDGYIRDSTNGYRLLETLKELAGIKKKVPEYPSCKDVFAKFVQNIGKDFANTLLVNEHCIQFMFDIISENSCRKLNILEINNNFALILPSIVKIVEKGSVSILKNKTLIYKNLNEKEQEKIDQCNIQVYSEALSAIAIEKKHGIVVGAICMSTKEEARQHLNLLSAAVDRKGFILLFHKNSILPPENLVASISGEAVTIVPHTVLKKWFEEEHLVVVSEITDDVGGSLYLLRRAAESSAGEIIRMREDTSWLDELKSCVKNEAAERIWVVSEGCPDSGIVGMVNCLRHEPGKDRVR